MRKASETITIRVTPSEKLLFQEHCENRGLSINQYIRQFIQKELYDDENLVEDRIDVLIKGQEEIIELIKDLGQPKQPVINKFVQPAVDNPKREGVVKRASSSPKGFMTRWQVDGYTACPVCKGWHASSNFSRDVKKKHNITSEEIFANPELIKIADEMVAARKGV